MKNIYEWNGPDETISHACTVSRLVVSSLEDGEEKRKKAKGEIWIFDHIEGCGGSGDEWEATGTPSNGSFQWEVKPINSFWCNKDTGEQCFTLCPTTNKGMAKFIGKKLNELVLLRQSGITDSIKIEPARYTGELVTYRGVCVCEQLKTSNKVKPFPWLELTEGGKFPQHCFKCSCGRCWWCYNSTESLWAPIGDVMAWAMLTEYNGVEVKPLTQHPERPELCLLTTIREEGFIPIG